MDEQRIRELVREETSDIGRLQTKVEELEKDLVLSKQQMLQTLQLINEEFSRELVKIMDDQRDGFLKIALEVISQQGSNTQ
ncbi:MULTISPECIES: hypothetical protein [unclassified Paenibacillus]|uniref:hypothetical protein n=1 Tax=unclassified Paenibacillus TaxID=185978 RepID=UPI0024733091|nr:MULTISPECIES: hypothetical protein [unclassified Paenibacillus]MDH6430286.1 flagellar motor switch protein FliM [Paenibacillus sp. PastH-4]MDH6446501.1 flagellar motor switch protein FliM [Paenibacillus sp. PastF-4]MDH6530033.1 flagellar motor switch protein FliM [Paenibacillus sp. PastH-3]